MNLSASLGLSVFAAMVSLAVTGCYVYPPPPGYGPVVPFDPYGPVGPDGPVGPPAPAPPPTPAAPEYPLATRTSNPNQVLSPFAPYNVINVEGFRSGQLARDPSNQRIFRIP